MAALSLAAQERILFLGLGLTTCAVISLMRRMLIHYRDAAAVQSSESKPQYITQAVEDSLKLSTLNKLLDSPSYGVQETTAIIICERALHDGTTVDALLYDLTRPDHDTRERGIRALTMMMNSSTITLMSKPRTYSALVTSLEYCVTDYEHNEYDPEWDNWSLRDIVEQGCLLIIVQLIDKFGVEGVIKARFIERWLVKEPWGSPNDEEERQCNFLDSLSRQNRLNEICFPLLKDPAGQEALEKAKLLPSSHREDEKVSVLDSRMAKEEDTAGEDNDRILIDSRRRRNPNSEEEHLRRRHREAMVLNDGTRPLERGDIIEQDR